VTTTVEPERELVRRLLPYAVPALAVAAAAGVLLGGSGAAASASIGVGVAAANFVASAASLAWAARISPTLLMIVGLGGFVLRLATLTVALLVLDRLAWFSPVAFAWAFVPTTVAVLVLESKLLFGRMQGNLWYFPERAS
jgi:hypothetical protein